MNEAKLMEPEIAAKVKADIRLQFAIEVAFLIGADVLPERCPDCRAPLLMMKNQTVPFCWECTTDRQAAKRAREALFKLTLAVQGITLEPDNRPVPAAPPALPEEPPAGPFRFGMPL